MSAVPTENPQTEAQKPSDKELNFRRQEEMFKRQLEQERAARLAAEEKLQQASQQRQQTQDDDDDDDSEPYVDRKRLKKEIGKIVKQVISETDNRSQSNIQQALAAERQSQWLKQNPDFNEIMGHAQTFADKDPEMAEIILSMPEGFERQKLVYKNIKALGLHKKPEAVPSIQDKIEANRRSPYYQPSGVGTAPYQSAGDFSPAGQKNAYDQMQA